MIVQAKLRRNIGRITVLTVFVLVAAGSSAFAADRYWVGGDGNWSDAAHWSTSSGGAGGASVPGRNDTVYFDANSGGGTCTVDVNYVPTSSRYLAGLIMTGSTTTINAGSATIRLNGDSVFVGSKFTASSSTVYFGQNSLTITPGTAEFNNVMFNGSNKTFTISGTMVVNGTTTLTHPVPRNSTMLCLTAAIRPSPFRVRWS